MMWVIRAGHNSLYYDKYIMNRKAYIPWDGYKTNLFGIETIADLREVVKKEKATNNRTSVSNWAGQLFSFTKEMQVGDFVLIPSKGSRTYCLARITGEYCFNSDEEDKLYHSRSIEMIEMNIPRDVFSQSVIYSLGAFRTIFKAKHEEEILRTIKEWKGGHR